MNYREDAQKLYKTKKWQRMRARQLKQRPMCQCLYCKEMNLEADTVDHIEPHKGNRRLFWDPRNIQSMAASCHSSAKQQYEKTGIYRGCDEQGNPFDWPEHWRS